VGLAHPEALGNGCHTRGGSTPPRARLRHPRDDPRRFKTDSRNERSQAAIQAIGAEREGTFCNHRILRGGYIRHSIFYSITVQGLVVRAFKDRY
jgi:hypothetical protein